MVFQRGEQIRDKATAVGVVRNWSSKNNVVIDHLLCMWWDTRKGEVVLDERNLVRSGMNSEHLRMEAVRIQRDRLRQDARIQVKDGDWNTWVHR